ncbi:MAG TPA: LPS export ABC transporter periplasmic protein LptC, partial [Stellaceae bacterium]|nr:LPS export ABC transporter periplasmic protein LptC [Stellaceae bacterium]
MIGRNGPRAISAAGRFAWRGQLGGMVSDWVARLPGNRYSRRVALLKLALPAIGGTLLLLVVVWPRVAPLFDRLRFAAIDLREARELRMINPRYAGTDREGRPVMLTAAVGRQVPQRDDVMSLDKPVANLQSGSGAKIVVTADTGVYQTQTQFLDLFGNVTINHEDGSTFVTSAARLDAANDAAEGHAAVEGHGPQGDITAQGFRILDKGEIVIFTGQSNLTLKNTKPQGPQPDPPAAATVGVPAPVAQAAAELAAT